MGTKLEGYWSIDIWNTENKENIWNTGNKEKEKILSFFETENIEWALAFELKNRIINEDIEVIFRKLWLWYLDYDNNFKKEIFTKVRKDLKRDRLMISIDRLFNLFIDDQDTEISSLLEEMNNSTDYSNRNKLKDTLIEKFYTNIIKIYNAKEEIKLFEFSRIGYSLCDNLYEHYLQSSFDLLNEKLDLDEKLDLKNFEESFNFSEQGKFEKVKFMKDIFDLLDKWLVSDDDLKEWLLKKSFFSSPVIQYQNIKSFFEKHINKKVSYVDMTTVENQNELRKTIKNTSIDVNTNDIEREQRKQITQKELDEIQRYYTRYKNFTVKELKEIYNNLLELYFNSYPDIKEAVFLKVDDDLYLRNLFIRPIYDEIREDFNGKEYLVKWMETIIREQREDFISLMSEEYWDEKAEEKIKKLEEESEQRIESKLRKILAKIIWIKKPNSFFKKIFYNDEKLKKIFYDFQQIDGFIGRTYGADRSEKINKDEYHPNKKINIYIK